MNNITITITEEQIHNMKHTIGYSARSVKRGKYIAYRNYFFDIVTPAAREPWEALIKCGYATVREHEESEPEVCYHITRDGMDYLERVLGVKIVEDKS